jgi:uncharacterized membrane protein YccC
MASAARDWYGAHRGALRAMVRATLAGTLSYAVVTALDLTEGFWAVMSALLVLQSTIGASLQSSLDRLAGTIGGVICGGIVGWLIPGQDPLAVIAALALTLVPLTYLAAINGHYRIAPVTAVITLILPRHLDSTPLVFALDRTLEVAIGGVIAVAVAFFIFPSHGHRLFATAAATALRTMAGVLAKLALAGDGTGRDPAELSTMLASVARALSALEDAATETRREIRLRLVDDPDPEPMLLLVRRIRNDTVMAFRAAAAPFPADFAARLAPAVDAVAAEAASFLSALADTIQQGGMPPSSAALDAALAAYGGAVQAIRDAGLSRPMPVGEVESLFSLGFAIEQLGADLTALADLSASHAAPRRRRAAATSAA